jgi:hypothetical protein
MATQIYAVVSPTGNVLNMILWDGVTALSVAPNTLVAAAGNASAQIGGTYIGGVFTAPAAPGIAQDTLFLNSPATGATVTLPNPPQPPPARSVLYVVLEPLITLTTLILPLPLTPADGDEVYIYSTKAVTTVTPVPAPGQILRNIPSPFALAAGVREHIVWIARLSSWVRL